MLPTENMFVFAKINISKYYKFAFSCQMTLKIIVELLKNAPALLKRYLPFWPHRLKF